MKTTGEQADGRLVHLINQPVFEFDPPGPNSYLGLNVFPDAFIEADDTLDTLETHGGYVAYRHWWNQNTRSNAVLSYAAADNPGDAYAGVNQEVQSVHMNLLHDMMDNVMVGVEYIWAERSIEGRINGQGSGDINRIQGSVRVGF